MTQNRILIAVALVLVGGYLSLFTVSETQKAIQFRLGEIVKTDFTPGLHFTIPIYNNVKKFDARVLTLDLKPERFLTSEKKNVLVDSYVKWRIKDPAKFYTTVSGDVVQANNRLDPIIKDGMRGEFSKRTIRELVSAGRGQTRSILIKNSSPMAEELGIEIVDIRVMRVELPPEVSASVYHRMEAERARVAKELRSRGAEAAERIRADADRQREVLFGDAYREAETLRGEGDATAADIYSKAYGKNPEFFAFYGSLNAYTKTFKNKDATVVLEPDSDFFRYFKKEKEK
ncbi:protease modulator HflC [Methylogaea oryzae]|uniref:Protein HflC n=1 Tax=Methylogaea oryzae TaxID=1295382 RepID=A0A8D5AN27_9GAMM|nr:protease modulator HflC [Methylogaea oryzae]BBL71670.1 protein HflC [Methylogaea oryzae]